MSFTVGLDFGTHQTKVCIENATNPAQKTYEFVEFKNPYGKPTVLFPSIVQINEDNTLSYGFINEDKCKYIHSKGKEKPKFKPLKKPILKLPTKPRAPILPKKPKAKVNTWKEKIKKLFNNISRKIDPEIIEWENECKRKQNDYIKAIDKWNNECKLLQEEQNERINEWRIKNKKRQKEYQNKLSEWKQNLVERYYYRYFKLATFSDSSQWKHKIDPDIISIWYISYILLMLQEKLGEDFFVQIGIPSGANKNILEIQSNKAYAILIAAYKLVEKYKTKENYLNEPYTKLLDSTELQIKYSTEDILYYGLNVIPEAYAGLSSITQQKRLENGMSLLVDIGGGTTDIAFFTIHENQPDIHSVISFPKGLNYIFENYIEQKPYMTIPEVQDIFLEKKGNKTLFNKSISQYHRQLLDSVKRMISEITRSFEFRKDFHKLPTYKLREALENRPVIFCGGGAIYNNMQTTLLNFKEIKLINRNLLNIPFVKNKNINEILYTILATSYGLSIPLEDEIKITPIEKVFNHIIGLDTDKWDDYKYDHGLSDF